MYSLGREASSISKGKQPPLSPSPFRCTTAMLTSVAVLPGRRPYCSRTRSKFRRMQNDFLTLHRISHKFYFCLKGSIFFIALVISATDCDLCNNLFLFLAFITLFFLFSLLPKETVVNRVGETFILSTSLFTWMNAVWFSIERQDSSKNYIAKQNYLGPKSYSDIRAVGRRLVTMVATFLCLIVVIVFSVVT